MKKPTFPMRGRRAFLRRTGLLAAAAGFPAIVRPSALASSGELNILMWSDYLPPDFIAGFERKTGIKINYTGIGSNEEILNKLKATKGRGFDICSPTNNRSLQWEPLGLLQPFDMARVNASGINPPMVKIGEDAWNFGGQGSHWLPHIWGTEGVAWRTDKWAPEGGTPSYGDIWDPANKGKTMGRPHSMMLGAGLHMETVGALAPGDMLQRAYADEDGAREVWGKVTEWCVARKEIIKLLWDDADTQKNGLLNEGVIVGQTWDGPPLALKTAGEPVTYQAPREGSMAWVDGMALPVGAENLDAVYELIAFAYDPEQAGKAIDKHGYNSPVLGADAHASAQYKKNFNEAYPGAALDNLNPWPAEGPWYVDIRTEHVERFKSA